MFTGIVEELGKVKNIDLQKSGGKLSVYSKKIVSDINLELGDSIAVNGVCLTVSAFNADFFTADIMAETLRYSNLKYLKPDNFVNLERAVSLNRKFGGHVVSGHIDGNGTISEIKSEGNSIWFTVKTNADILKYIIFKGSVAVDGISLTAAQVDKESFSISVTPHTIKNTSLNFKKKGDLVNIESDLIAKYVEKLLDFNKNQLETPAKNNISMDFLIKNGF